VTQTIGEIFGIESDDMAWADHADPQTPGVRTYTTAVNSPGNHTPESVMHALTDPKGSAIFWVGLAALLGLILVTGQVRFETGAKVGVGGGAGTRLGRK
jgi:hypothetical protein